MSVTPCKCGAGMAQVWAKRGARHVFRHAERLTLCREVIYAAHDPKSSDMALQAHSFDACTLTVHRHPKMASGALQLQMPAPAI
eukprot:365441-Chlamydomonas_euryale.AAC.11